MDEMLERLQKYGADVEGAMARFVDDVDLYKTCFNAFLKDEAFQQLGKELAAKDYDKAFEYAHTLKGTSGNMGFIPLYEIICNIVEALKKRDYFYLQDYYAEVIEQLDKLKSLQK